MVPSNLRRIQPRRPRPAGALVIFIGLAIALSSPRPTAADSFEPIVVRWADTFCVDGEVCGVGDFNGDGRDDIISFVRDSATGEDRGDIYVALSDGSRFSDAALWHGGLCFGDEVCGVGDVNGDGRDDALAFIRDSRAGDERGDVYVALSTVLDYRPPRVYLPMVKR
jgi:hypothetical protein